MASFQDADSFSAIDEARTTDFPNRDDEKAWKNFKEMYKPKNVQTKIKLKKKFNNCKLKPSMNPTTWFNELSVLRQELKGYSAVITDDTMIEHILSNMPSSY